MENSSRSNYISFTVFVLEEVLQFLGNQYSKESYRNASSDRWRNCLVVKLLKSRLTHASILLRLIKYAPGATEGLVVKSKPYPWSDSAVFRKLNPIHIKGLGSSFLSKIMFLLVLYLIKS